MAEAEQAGKAMEEEIGVDSEIFLNQSAPPPDGFKFHIVYPSLLHLIISFGEHTHTYCVFS